MKRLNLKKSKKPCNTQLAPFLNDIYSTALGKFSENKFKV